MIADDSYAYLVGELNELGSNAVINVLRIDFPTSINETSMVDNAIYVYPNPVVDKQINFNVYFNKVNVSFYDCYGRLVQRNSNFSGSRIILNHDITSGIYFIEVASNKFFVNKKIIIN